MITAWESSYQNGISVLRALLSGKIVNSNGLLKERRHWKLTSRIIEIWYGENSYLVYQLLDDLETIILEDDFRIQLLCAEPGGKAILQKILEHVTGSITKQEFEWREASPRLNFLFKLAMGDPSSARYAKHLAMACGEHLPLLTDKEEQILPDIDVFRQCYALGVLTQNGNAMMALKLLRKIEGLTVAPTDLTTPEEYGELILQTMYFSVGNDEINRSIENAIAKLRKMPGGEKVLRDIMSRAPSNRIGETE